MTHMFLCAQKRKSHMKRKNLLPTDWDNPSEVYYALKLKSFHLCQHVTHFTTNRIIYTTDGSKSVYSDSINDSTNSLFRLNLSFTWGSISLMITARIASPVFSDSWRCAFVIFRFSRSIIPSFAKCCVVLQQKKQDVATSTFYINLNSSIVHFDYGIRITKSQLIISIYKYIKRM